MAKVSKALGAYSITSVPISAIEGQDPFTARILATHQYESDTAVNLECWDAEVVQPLAARLLPILIKRRSGYLYLGSGHALLLLQQIFEPHEEILAIVLDAKRVSTKLKLNVLSGDLLLLPPFFRTRRFLPRRNFQLWRAIVEAGGAPILGHGVQAFCRATGYSYNALKPPKAKKTVTPWPGEIARPPGPIATEDQA